MIALDTRLRCIYEAVGECDCLADIGSDHALLPIALLQTGRIKHAIACDINTGPLEQSKKNAQRYNMTNIAFFLSDGFDSLMDCSFDKASICGMGGILIADIVKRGGIKAHCDLILQPMTAFDELRFYLWNNGFTIENEHFAADADKPYVVMNVRYTEKQESFDFSELFLGKIKPNTPEFRLFCKKISLRAKKQLAGLKHTGIPCGSALSDLEKLIFECTMIIG